MQGGAPDAAVRLERGRAVPLCEELGLAHALSERLPELPGNRWSPALGRLEPALRGIE